MKRIFKTLNLILVVLSLVGCAKQNVHMDITNSKVTIKVTDVMNSSIRSEEDVKEMVYEYKEKGYKVEEYEDEEGRIGVIYSKSYKLSEVSGENDVVFHLETIGTDKFDDSQFFKVKKGLLGNTYTATFVLDTSVFLDLDEGETQEENEEEISEYASSIDISYTVTLPNKAKSHNADLVDGKTYTWNVEYGKRAEINYVFKTTSPLIYIAVISITLIVIALVVYSFMKKNKNIQNAQVVTNNGEKTVTDVLPEEETVVSTEQKIDEVASAKSENEQ